MNRQSRTDKWVYVGGTIVQFVAVKRDNNLQKMVEHPIFYANLQLFFKSA